MAREDRIKLIREIQKERASKVITYITSTRQGLEVSMAMDQIRLIYSHLVKFLPKDKSKINIDLYLHTYGGDGTVPWRMITLFREYSQRLAVLVPYCCFSAGTLTALGADEILMHQMGVLGPTDPTVTNEFNPQDPNNPARKLGISVEDVTAYLQLLKEDAGIRHEDELIQGVRRLAETVHPLALGNVKRSLSQSRMMAQKLLDLHMKGTDTEHKVEGIVDNLTSKLYFHGHPINRREAKEQVGLQTVVAPSSNLENLMWNLYLEYEKEMELEVPFNPVMEFLNAFPDQAVGSVEVTPLKTCRLAYIESEDMSHVSTLAYVLSGTRQADQTTKVNLIKRKQAWEMEA